MRVRTVDGLGCLDGSTSDAAVLVSIEPEADTEALAALAHGGAAVVSLDRAGLRGLRAGLFAGHAHEFPALATALETTRAGQVTMFPVRARPAPA